LNLILGLYFTVFNISFRITDEPYLNLDLFNSNGVTGNLIEVPLALGFTKKSLDISIYLSVFGIEISNLSIKNLEIQMTPFAQKRERIITWNLDNPNKISLKDVIKNAKSTVLIGATAQPKVFDSEIIQLVNKNTDRPIFFALSNPTSQSECTPKDVYYNTNGKGLIATGSPFEPIDGEYGKMYISQANNMYIFPGIGLGGLITRTPYITHKMFLAASKELSALLSNEELYCGKLLPDLENIREISAKIAIAVAKEARNSGLGIISTDEELEFNVRKAQWDGKYRKYRYAKI